MGDDPAHGDVALPFGSHADDPCPPIPLHETTETTSVHTTFARQDTSMRHLRQLGSRSPSKLHRDAVQRLELADRAQQAYFLAYELECEMADLAVWTGAMIIPQSWRLAIRKHLAPLVRRMKVHVAHLIQAESHLLPPFHPRNLAQFEGLLQRTEDISVVLYDTMQECKRRATDGERVVAATMIQRHVRRHLRAKGFYTKIVKLTRLQRGLIPGLFDGLKGETIMSITADAITLEYPKALNRPSPAQKDGRPNDKTNHSTC